jgi:outer membrane protein OmpA-like peptidoglycan-associated protein
MKNIIICFIALFVPFLCFSPTLANDCSRAIELFNRGTQDSNAGVKERLFQEALVQPCNNPEIRARIHNNLADTFETQKRFPQAITEYKKSIELDPALPTPYVSLGDVYSKLKDFKSAQIYYKKYGEMSRFKSRERLRSVLNPRAIHVTPIQGKKTEPSEYLYFGFNEAILTEESESQLQELLAALGDDELKKYRFLLAGHTCSIGSEEYNQRLSEERAKEVKDWLVKKGYPADRLMVTGYGKSKPLADNSNEEGRKLNRRVEIRTIGLKE